MSKSTEPKNALAIVDEIIAAGGDASNIVKGLSEAGLFKPDVMTEPVPPAEDEEDAEEREPQPTPENAPGKPKKRMTVSEAIELAMAEHSQTEPPEAGSY